MKKTWTKKVFSLILSTAMLLSLGSWAYAASEPDPSPSAGHAEELFTPGTVPAESGALESMAPPINALVMCMVEQDLSYDETSEVFFWNSLYYMISLYGEMDSRAERTDDTLILPAETVEDYASALFTNYSGLPALPDDLRGRVEFDWQTDSYSLARGDAGLTETRIHSASPIEGGLVVSGALVDLDAAAEVCTFSATLTCNGSMFGYSVSELDIL